MWSMFFSCAIEITRSVELLVGLEHHFAGRRVDDVGGREGARERVVDHFDPVDVRPCGARQSRRS